MAPVKIGILTTGQSPRPEYRSFHRNALAKLGIDAEIIEVACLDGLTREGVREIEIDPAKGTGIGCYVHAGTSDARMGSGWEEVFIDHATYVRRAQAGIDRLEAQGVALTMVCCAEQYPEGAFRSRRPVILPYTLFFNVVRGLVETLGRVRLGLLIPTPWHIAQDRATWRSQTWMKSVETTIGVGIANGKGVAELRGKPHDLVLIWGYGDGLAKGDPDTLIADIERELDAPVITPNILNIQRARLLLRPAQPERVYVDYNG
jgi:hypothetical protein